MIDYSKKSLQFIFNKISRHLINQNKKAGVEGSGFFCYYKLDKTRCAAGCLLPLSFYKKHGNINTIDLLGKVGISKKYPYNNMVLIMIKIHDTKPVRDWKKELRQVAENFSLKVPSYLEN